MSTAGSTRSGDVSQYTQPTGTPAPAKKRTRIFRWQRILPILLVLALLFLFWTLFAPRALAEVQRFASQFKVPLLSLTPIDTLKSLVLDPTQLRAVQAALSLAKGADSTKAALEAQFQSLRIQETIDSSAALAARMQN